MVAHPKPKPIRLPQYLEFLKTLPCTNCRRIASAWMDVVPAHQGFGVGGIARKNDDNLALPLCMECHVSEHRFGVRSFWKRIDRKMEIINCLTAYITRGKDGSTETRDKTVRSEATGSK